jgi:hypothetical protein
VESSLANQYAPQRLSVSIAAVVVFMSRQRERTAGRPFQGGRTSRVQVPFPYSVFAYGFSCHV